MTLQQQALHAVQVLPEEKLPVLIEFARSVADRMTGPQLSEISERRRALAGVLKGQVKMAEDFNETPEFVCFPLTRNTLTRFSFYQ